MDYSKIEELLSVEKPNQIEKVKINKDRIRKILPKNIHESQYEEFIIKSIEFYSKYLQRKKNQKLDR